MEVTSPVRRAAASYRPRLLDAIGELTAATTPTAASPARAVVMLRREGGAVGPRPKRNREVALLRPPGRPCHDASAPPARGGVTVWRVSAQRRFVPRPAPRLAHRPNRGDHAHQRHLPRHSQAQAAHPPARPRLYTAGSDHLREKIGRPTRLRNSDRKPQAVGSIGAACMHKLRTISCPTAMPSAVTPARLSAVAVCSRGAV